MRPHVSVSNIGNRMLLLALLILLIVWATSCQKAPMPSPSTTTQTSSSGKVDTVYFTITTCDWANESGPNCSTNSVGVFSYSYTNTSIAYVVSCEYVDPSTKAITQFPNFYTLYYMYRTEYSNPDNYKVNITATPVSGAPNFPGTDLTVRVIYNSL